MKFEQTGQNDCATKTTNFAIRSIVINDEFSFHSLITYQEKKLVKNS